MKGPGGLNYLNMLPDFTNNWDLAVAVFIIPITVQWWATWYPGAEPGGGSYIAQRMLASKSEKDALGGTLFFNVAHYVLRPWPWILVGLASLIVYPELSDIQKAFPNLDPTLLGHDIAYPAMLRFLPVGWVGLMLGGLIAANSSTILTHLNWGASYLVHDFYRRFINTGRHREALRDGRPLRHRAPVRRLVGHGVPALHRQGQFQPAAPGRRRHRPALPAALVLVAHHRVVRNRRHDQFLRRRHRFPDPLQERCGLRLLRNSSSSASRSPPSAGSPPPISARRPTRRCCSRFYEKVRPFGPGWRHIQAESPASPTVEGDNIPLALTGLDHGLHHDLVGALHGRQFPVRANHLRADPRRRSSPSVAASSFR